MSIKSKLSSKKKKEQGAQQRVTLLDASFPFAVTEAFKALRTNLMFALSTKSNSKIFAVSSALPSEGKSTIAANLAITFAQTDSKVLFIDADLRKPVVHRTFNLKNKVGLSTLLGGIDSFREVLYSQVSTGLDIITSGPIPPNPSEMLGSENMKVLLDKLVEFYDYIIIDTPPINIVSDTLNMLPYIAGVVLVARQGETPNEAFEEAVNSIKFADGHLLGAILARVETANKKGNKHTYNKYGYSYSYQQENNDEE